MLAVGVVARGGPAAGLCDVVAPERIALPPSPAFSLI